MIGNGPGWQSHLPHAKTQPGSGWKAVATCDTAL
jgi:hypothetical protein